MKSLLYLISLCLIFSSPQMMSGGKHSHDGSKPYSHVTIKAGPNGGKVFKHDKIAYEFHINSKRHIQLSLLDALGKAQAFKGASAKVICGDRNKPTKISFINENGKLVSTSAIPDGAKVPAIITLTLNEQTYRDRIDVNMSVCGGCKLNEYACTCGH